MFRMDDRRLKKVITFIYTWALDVYVYTYIYIYIYIYVSISPESLKLGPPSIIIYRYAPGRGKERRGGR